MDPCCPALPHPLLPGAPLAALPAPFGRDEGGDRVPSTPCPSPSSLQRDLPGRSREVSALGAAAGQTPISAGCRSRWQREVPVPGFSNASALLKRFQGFSSGSGALAVPGAAVAAGGAAWDRPMRAVGEAAAPGEGKGRNSPSQEKICGRVTPRQGRERAGGGRVASEGLLRGQSCFPWGSHLRAGVSPPGAAVTERGEAAGHEAEQGISRGKRNPNIPLSSGGTLAGSSHQVGAGCHTPVASAPPEVPRCVPVQSPEAGRPRGWHGGPSRATPAVPVPTLVALWCRRGLSWFSWRSGSS